MTSTTLTVSFPDGDREVEVRYDFYPATHGARGSFGEPLEPDEPARVEIHGYKLILDARRKIGEDIEDQLTDLQKEKIEREILEREL